MEGRRLERFRFGRDLWLLPGFLWGCIGTCWRIKSKKVASRSSGLAIVVPQLAECLSDKVGLNSFCDIDGGGGILCSLGRRPDLEYAPSLWALGEFLNGLMKLSGRRCRLSSKVTVGTGSGAASSD